MGRCMGRTGPAPGAGMSAGDVLMDARMAKAAGRNGSWVAANCRKERSAMPDALRTSLEAAPKAV